MTFDEYRAIDAINATAIKAGRVSMLHMRDIMAGRSKAPTASMQFGTLAHKAVLAGMGGFAVWTGGVKRGKAFDEFAAANAEKDIVGVDTYAALLEVRDNVERHDAAGVLIHRITAHEHPITWTDERCGDCKALLDGITPDSVIEIKTTSSISPAAFGRQFVSMGYDLQCGWYSYAHGNRPVYVIAIETAPPYAVAVYRVPDMVVKVGYKRAADIAARYRECERDGRFPGPADDVTELPVPEWYMQSDDVAACFAEAAASELDI